MERIRAVAYCPHCGNRAPQQLVHVQRFLAYGFSKDGTRDEHGYFSTYFVAKCETCGEILLYLDEFDDIEEKFFIQAYLVWPDKRELHPSVPKKVRDCYEEAARIRQIAPNAFAGQIRRALEAICDDKGIAKAKLIEMIEELGNCGLIPPTLVEISHILRGQGNIGSHADSESVKPGDVPILDDFFRLIVDYAYVAPNKLEEFRKKLNPLNL